MAEQQESRKLIIRDINAALRLLEQRDFVSFMSEYVDPSIGIPQAGVMASMLPASRGMQIARLDQALAVLQSPQFVDAVQIEGDRCTISAARNFSQPNLRSSGMPSRPPILQMRYLGDKWVIKFQ